MPDVSLAPETFKRLQRRAVPLVDSVDDVVRKLLDATEDTTEPSSDIAQPAAVIPWSTWQPADINLPLSSGNDIEFTKVTRAHLQGECDANWNSLMRKSIALAVEHEVSFDDLRSLVPVNIRQGQYSKDGFKFVSESGLSVQGMPSVGAWQSALAVAKHLKLPIAAQFRWRDSPKAKHPGKLGMISWKPE